MNEDTDKLLLSASRFPGIDVPFAVNQILIRKQLKYKVPEWSAHPDLVFPSRISAEQCSSFHTALYKQDLIRGKIVCDLTGGLGVDSWYFSRKAEKVVYIEQNKEYCEAATTNFEFLYADNIRILHADSTQVAETIEADTFYIDPARRSASNARLFALSDCEPNVLEIKSLLLKKAYRLIIKISPMADITESLRLLPETVEVHVLSVKNECKELLFVLEETETEQREIEIHTVNYTSDDTSQYFHFSHTVEKNTSTNYTSSVKKYLYEPNASLLKAGAFKLPAEKFGMEKLHQHSHLYTSDKWIPEFPGRCFLVTDVLSGSGKELNGLGKKYPKANISVRNFPLSVDEIRKRGKVKEGGNYYLFASTLGNNDRVIIVCTKATNI